MGRAKELTSEERSAILALHRTGMSLRAIAKKENRSYGAVQHVVKSGSVEKPPTKRGRQRKIDDRSRRQVVRTILTRGGGAKTARDALQLPVCVRTIQRSVVDIPWLKYRKIRSSPRLLPRHVKARLQWAQEHDGLDAFWWANVMFSDEKKWNLDGPDGLRRRWVDTRQKKQLCVRRHTGGGGVMVWGGFCGGKKTELKFLDGRVNSAKYIATLQTHLQPAFDNSTQIFQHDNASCHASRMTRQWVHQQNIEVLPWPALSPDVNPIENAWGYLTHAVYQDGTQYFSVDDLKQAISRAWDAMPDSYLAALVKSMPHRVQALLSEKGGYISY